MDSLYNLTCRFCLFSSWHPNLTGSCTGILPAPVFKMWAVAAKQGVVPRKSQFRASGGVFSGWAHAGASVTSTWSWPSRAARACTRVLLPRLEVTEGFMNGR